ncbi:MAG: DUF4125 family protein [Lachnospiraceae bacterium]|nr:DUF4125 family protein [Lachnospiraceae bacterium]
MNVEEIIKKLDELFTTGKGEEVASYLEDCLAEAEEKNDQAAKAFLLNELIGHMRSLGRHEDSIEYSKKAIELMEELGVKDTMSYATTLLNVATAYRAAGRYEEALSYYQEMVPIYEKNLKPDDFLIASYSNNVGLLYQEMGDFENACLCLSHAIEVAKKHEGAEGEIATSYSNLGISKVRLGKLDEGIACFKEAMRLFESIGDTGYHYAAALSGMGEAMYCLDKYNEAIDYYKKAAEHIKAVYGENEAYKLTLQNIEAVKADLPEGFVLSEPEVKDLTKEEMIDKIANMEWIFFDKTRNEGGRASCQDDSETFFIMRKSQYMTWDDELLKSYLDDLMMYEKVGENPIAYKYGYMMETTTPEKFAEIRDILPPVEPERRALVDQICKIQVGWLEDFAAEAPHVAGRGRSIHTSEDNPVNTSAETYLRGELFTYSDKTLKLYGQMIVRCAKDGVNLNRCIMENTVKLYGYESIEAAEKAYS